MGAVDFLDTILVPLSLFFTVGYHVYLWHNIKNKPSHTSLGIDKMRRMAWFQKLDKGDDKKAMLAIQSLRNTLMATILTASIAILVNLFLAALTNNSYSARYLFSSEFFGSQAARIFAFKYGSASLCLIVSFLCSSMAVGFLIDANFLMNTADVDQLVWPAAAGMRYTETIFKRGFTLAVVGNRVLCISVPLLLWMLGPVPVLLSSSALVWVLYDLDFTVKLTKTDHIHHCSHC